MRVSEQKQIKSNKIFVVSAAANATSSGLITKVETTRNRLVVRQCLADKSICVLFHPQSLFFVPFFPPLYRDLYKAQPDLLIPSCCITEPRKTSHPSAKRCQLTHVYLHSAYVY